ncbi:MAG: hypothetical protein K5663_02610 [Clostridiales bacterium]|nr:hypothetical protein [Clostridiales bacterium]
MFKALLKKQLMELKEVYTPRSRKSKKKTGTKGFVILFAVLTVSISFSFVGMSFLFADAFLPLELDWVYFMMMAAIALVVSVVGSVFSAYSILYSAKDNEFLMAMPIPPATILSVRLIAVFLSGFLFECMALVPAIVVYAIRAGVKWYLLLQVVDLLWIGLLALVLTSLLGFLVGLVVVRARHKSLTTILVSLILLALYYFIYFRLNSFLQAIATNAAFIGESVSGKAKPVMWVSQAFTGNLWGFLLLAGTSVILMALTVLLLSRHFGKIAFTNKGVKKVAYVERPMKQKGVAAALLRREFVRFFQTPAYVLNCGLGILLSLALCVYALIRFDFLKTGLATLLGSLPPEFKNLLAFVPAVAAGFMGSMNVITAPSISLEGNSLWLLKCMPITSKQIFNAKQGLHLILNLPAVIPCCAIISALMGLNMWEGVVNVIYGVSLVAYTSAMGLYMGLKKPLLDWTNEAVPIKQSASVAITMFSAWALVLAESVGAYFLRNSFNAVPFLFVLPLALCALLNRHLYTRGEKEFMDL